MVGTHLLPPNLLKLFAPRPALPYLRPLGRDPGIPLKSLAKGVPTLGVADVVKRLREAKELEEEAKVEEGVVPEQEEEEEEEEMEEEVEEGEEGEEKKVKKVVLKKKKKELFTITAEEARVQRVAERKKRHVETLEKGIKDYNPAEDEEAVGDPYKTLFVGRLPHSVTEADLRKEFGVYGALERVRVVQNKEGKSRGYAFLVFDREKDMKAAYKDAEGLKMQNRRLLIDVERGRTVKGWKPRRLGGGLGGKPKPVVAPPPESFGPNTFTSSMGPPSRGGYGGGMGGGGGGFGGGGGGGQRGGFVQRGGGFNDRGGGRGGYNDRGGFNGGGGGGGFRGNDRGGYGGGGDRGGGGGRGGYGGGDRGGYPGGGGGGGRGGSFGGRGGGFGGGGGGGFNQQQQQGGGGGGGFQGTSGDSGWNKRPMDGNAPQGRGGFQNGGSSGGGGGDYDSSKRARY